MTTAIKSHTPGVVIVDRGAFRSSLGGGLALMASAVMSPSFRLYDKEMSPDPFGITVNDKWTEGRIAAVTRAYMGYVEVEIQYRLEGDDNVTTVKIGVELDFTGDELDLPDYETDWDAPYDPANT